MTTRHVAVLVGSLRKDSFNRKVALALATLAAPALKLEIVAIGDLAHYNEDDESVTPPAAWTAFRQAIKPADALLFVTPEFNRSVPGALKNAIDVASRPYGANVFDGKPAAVISVSPGAIGGFGANHHLRQSLMCLNVAVMPAPEAYIGGAAKLFDASGALADATTKAFLQKFATAFAAWIEIHSKK